MTTPHCKDCGKALTADEAHYYGATCEACEGKAFHASQELDPARPAPSPTVGERAEPAGWVGPELTPESMTELAVAIGELSQAMGSPCVMGRAPQTLKSQTVRMAAFRLKEAEAAAPPSNPPAQGVGELPPLPEPIKLRIGVGTDAYVYNEEHMQAYARAALAQAQKEQP